MTTARPRLHCYQWTGVYAADFTLEGVRQRCVEVAANLVERKWSCLVAHDTRFLNAAFARYAYLLLEAQGVSVSFCPTPAPLPVVELALEQRRADCALVVSAGNAAHWYNGLLLFTPINGPALDVTESHTAARDVPFPPPLLVASDRTQLDLRAPYLDVLRTFVDVGLIRRSSLTIFVDAMNGTASGYIPALLGEGAQTKAIEINRETDPLFGRQSPQPSEANLQRLRKLVKESDSHLGVAISADGRALGVADNTGELVTPTETTLLLAQYLARQHRQRGAVVVPAPGDETPLRRWARASGLKLEIHANPTPRITELLIQDRGSMTVGVTAAGEVSVGRSAVAPDALLAALLLIEMVARSGGKLRTHVDELRAKMSTP